MIAKAIRYARQHGLRRTLARAYRVLHPERIAGLPVIRPRLAGKHGLEIGGPTPLFQPGGLIPVYRFIGSLDNINFSTHTVWEGELRDEGIFRFDDGRRCGRQLIREAVRLEGLPDESRDFVVSSHVIEHLANPLAALHEWRRVLKPGGLLLAVIPHREGTFDHRRPVTPLPHLVEDFHAGTGEDDLTHLPEILALHDLSRDPGADPATFADRGRHNYANRCLHHHVFDTAAAIRLLDHADLGILCVEARLPCHICVLAEKPPAGRTADNRPWLSPSAPCRRRSPFVSDRPGQPAKPAAGSARSPAS